MARPFTASFKENKFGNALNAKIPEPGKGFIYKATVKRIGKPDAIYIGATTRSVKERFADRRRTVAKLFGDINPSWGPARKGKVRKLYNLPTSVEPLEMLMRTAGGVTQITQDPFLYTTVEYIGEYSLISLAEAEKHFISMAGGPAITSVQPNVYEMTLDTINLNRGAGGEGLNIKGIPVEVKIISAFYYLRDETSPKYVPKDELELLWNIASLAYKSSVSKNYDDRRIQTTRRRLLTYFALKEEMIAYFENNPNKYSSRTAIIAALRTVLTDVGTGKTNLTAEKTVAKLGLDNKSILEYFTRTSEDAGMSMQSLKMVQKEAVKEIADKYIERIEGYIQTVLDAAAEKRRRNKKK